MKKQHLSFMMIVILGLMSLNTLQAQTGSKYSSIPRVDAHAHFGIDLNNLDRVMELRRQAKEKTGIDIALWIDLGKGHRAESLDPNQPVNIEEVLAKYKNRILPCINDYVIRDGLAVPPDDLIKWQFRGVAGYKIHCGSQGRTSTILPQANKLRWWDIDHPANDATFTKMEQLGMVAAGMHIASPYLPEGTENWTYSNNALEFWSAIHALENILDRHPDLVVVGAHMLWLCSSKDQLDYLDYLLEKYPNLYVDTTFVYPFLARAGDDYTKKFLVKRADRILFGTDVNSPRLSGTFWDKKAKDNDHMLAYVHFYKTYFDLFEEKLALPRDVLEKIYYKNAMRIYPHVKESLVSFGYNVE